MKRILHIVVLTGLVGGLVAHGTPAYAQDGHAGPGGEGKIQKLLKKVQTEMATIDKLLNRASQTSSSSGGGAGKSSGTGKSSGAGSDELNELLQGSMQQSRSVVELIDKILEMAKKSGQGSSQSDNKKPRDTKPGEKRNRRPDGRLDQLPDMVRQQRERERRERERRMKRGPKAARDKGKQQRGKTPPDSGTKRFNKDAVEGRWGDLPKYLQLLFRKGGEPKVPAKYRRFRDEFHRRADQSKR